MRLPVIVPPSKQLLILDIDETLVYADTKPLSVVASDLQVGQYLVYRRPFLSEFLGYVNEWFDLAVWSSASAAYVDSVVASVFDHTFSLRFVWSRDRCTRRYDAELQEHYFAKTLTKARRIGYSLERILIIDDSPEKVSLNYGNHIRVRPFKGNPADTELRDLLPFLSWLRGVENVRRVEKRLWRSFKPPESVGHM